MHISFILCASVCSIVSLTLPPIDSLSTPLTPSIINITIIFSTDVYSKYLPYITAKPTIRYRRILPSDQALVIASGKRNETKRDETF
jgi:hypothetical protein